MPESTDVTPGAEKDAAYESVDYYDVQDLADWLHPWLEGRLRCAFSPKTLCPHTSRSRQVAEALVCKDSWIEGLMYHRLIAQGRVFPAGADHA